MFSRAAISFSAEATSSACWRLSSWQGPAMIEIGRSLPNLTVPMVTTGAADVEELKANPSFRRDHSRHRGRINPIRPGLSEYQGCAGVPRRAMKRERLLDRGERRRRQELADDIADDLAVRFALGACFHPVRIGHELAPLRLALGKRLPRQEIGQFLVRFADQRGEESGLLDAVLFPNL